MESRYTLVLLLLFVGLCDHQARAQETPGWNCGDHRFCYQLWSEKVDLDRARVKCKREGEQAQENKEMIACPRNGMDIEQIYKRIKDSKEEYWIGAVSLPNSNVWKCADEASSPIGNVSWAQGHPKASSIYAFIKNGMVVSTTGKTIDRNFICQKKNAAYISLPDATTRQTARPTKIAESPDKRRMADSDTSTHVNFIECGNNTCMHSCASNTNYYYGASGNSNWAEVAKLCMNMNAHLATPSTLKKHQELAAYIRLLPDFISKSNTWIGLYYPKETGVKETYLSNRRMGWKWIDNSTYDVTVSQWGAEEPANDERYVRIRNEIWFAIFDASDAKYFICEKDCGEPGANCFGTELSSSASPQTAISSSCTSTTSPSTDSNNVEFIQNVQACGDLPSWQYSSSSNMCYLLDKTRRSESNPVMSWRDVKEECERLSGNLVCPSTAAKHEEVVKMLDMEKIPTLNVWIGLQCKNNVTWNFMCYEWQWVDGSAYDNSWHKWANNEPGRGETLARIRDEQWYAGIDDRDAEYYICEKAAKWIVLPSPTYSPAMTTLKAASDKNGSEENDVLKLTESKRNLPLLAILTLVLPVVLIPTLVILFGRWKKARNNAEHAASTQDRRNQGRNLELKDYEHLKNPFLATADNSFYASIGNDEYEYIDINSIYSAGIKFGFIPTRTPAVGNAANFWKTAWDNNCDTIIMLCTPDQLGRRLYYPHKDGESCDVTPFLVECNMIKPGKHISCQHLNVTLPGKEIRQFLHVHVLCEDLSAKASEELVEIFLEMYHRVRKRKLQFKKNTPNIVHCLDGAHWTGLFCAFCGVLDQIDLKKEVDISRVWDLLRPSQTQFISSKEQHVKLVEMIFDFIKNQDLYSEILDRKDGFGDISGNGRVRRHYENA